jgi:DNA polymerase-4
MDAFFAAIAQLDHPELRGKPVLTGADHPRAVVTTASYEARPYGCRSAMPMATAKRLCPHAVVTQVPGQRIRAMSDAVFAMLRDVSPVVEPVSVDEAYVDVTGSERLLGDGGTIAKQLKARIYEQTGLIASIGVAPNKLLAKLASDMDKPDGLRVIQPDEVADLLRPMRVHELRGIGPATARTLEAVGLRTAADVRQWDEAQLAQRFGEMGRYLHALVHGHDDRPVTPDHQAKSIGQEHTFRENIDGPEHLKQMLLSQVEHVTRRLRRHHLRTKGLTLKLRFADFRTITRSRRLDQPTDLTADLWPAAEAVFNQWARREFEPIRLIGVTAQPITEAGQQLGLFNATDQQRQQRLEQTLDAIAERFGEATIHRGLGQRRR